MAEFKFACPQCGQHIQCDSGYSGAQINCPSCQQSIVVPQSPRIAAAPPAMPPPPPAPPGLSTKQSTTVPAAGRRFAGVPGAQPPPKAKSKALKTVLSVVAALVGAAIGFFAVQYFMGHLGHLRTAKPNPAAQVATPTAAATVQALSVLTKVHSAYTNFTSIKEDGTVTLFLDLSNLTFADLNPDAPVNTKNPNRRPQGMPRTYTLTADYSVKRAQSNWFYVAGEAAMKVDRQAQTITFALWAADKGTFEFMDAHQGAASATYMQIADAGTVNNQSQQVTEQVRNMQQLFGDPAQLTKIIKDLGQTADEPVNGKDCYTLTAKVLGQKMKIWVDKSTYLISQSQITLGGAISDADVDDAFSLAADAFTNLPPAQLEMIKPMVKKYTPAMMKIRGTVTSTSKNMELNPTLSAADFNYPVPAGVRLIRMPGAAGQAATASTPAAARTAAMQNACINNLRQIDGAKDQFALEKGKKVGDAVTEADIKLYLPGGVLPKCPAGGKYTLGKVGESPTCSIAGHALP